MQDIWIIYNYYPKVIYICILKMLNTTKNSLFIIINDNPHGTALRCPILPFKAWWSGYCYKLQRWLIVVQSSWATWCEGIGGRHWISHHHRCFHPSLPLSKRRKPQVCHYRAPCNPLLNHPPPITTQYITGHGLSFHHHKASLLTKASDEMRSHQIWHWSRGARSIMAILVVSIHRWWRMLKGTTREGGLNCAIKTL